MRPDITIYETMEQRSDEWYAVRMGVATASQFKRVVGGRGGDLTYMCELIGQKLTSRGKDLYFGDAIEHGVVTEERAVANYELISGHNVSHVGFIKWGEFLGCSPDGLVDDNGLIEVKCPDTHTFIKWKIQGGVPKDHIHQVLGSLWITGREWCDFVYYDPRMPTPHTVFTVRVTAEEYKKEIHELAEKVLDFREKMIGYLEIFK